jgi:hypothetical protein
LFHVEQFGTQIACRLIRFMANPVFICTDRPC